MVDISHEMMRIGEKYEKSIGRGRIAWYHADVSNSLDRLSLGPCDTVIANGVFDHAHDVEELEGMWRNAASCLKPGGQLVANRNNPLSHAAVEGKYDVTFTDFEEIPGGLSFEYRMMTEPPLIFESIALEACYMGSLGILKQFFEDFQNFPWQGTPVVKADP